ncbi:hypothetical protein UT300003_34120 [Clostridium sardiniense]
MYPNTKPLIVSKIPSLTNWNKLSTSMLLSTFIPIIIDKNIEKIILKIFGVPFGNIILMAIRKAAILKNI